MKINFLGMKMFLNFTLKDFIFFVTDDLQRSNRVTFLLWVTMFESDASCAETILISDF